MNTPHSNESGTNLGRSQITAVQDGQPSLDIVPGELAAFVAAEYQEYGPSKPMVEQEALDPGQPKYFLLRKFGADNDLLVILNTKRCKYQCDFCTLPLNSSRDLVDGDQIVDQFRGVTEELRSALSIINKVTLSNDGSILDETTMPPQALDEIVGAIGEMRRVDKVDLETRLEYVDSERLVTLGDMASRATIGILTGFETVDEEIRDRTLKKRESLAVFRQGLDELQRTKTPLTAYVLFKPHPSMSDSEAVTEARRSIQFLHTETSERGLPLMVRLNPMYSANGSKWARVTASTPGYQPPRLTDVMQTAEWALNELGVPMYVGLSVEDRADKGKTYRGREDFMVYGKQLIQQAALFNAGRIREFDLYFPS